MTDAAKDLEVLMVAAYYKNNEAGGVGVTLHFVSPRAGVHFCLGLEDCLPVYDSFGLDKVLASLAQLARTQPETKVAASEAIMGIYWLQVRGHLDVVDEYNGTMFHCIHRGNLVFCERNPVTTDLDTALTSKSAVDVTSIIKASKAPGVDRGMVASIRTVVDHARERNK